MKIGIAARACMAFAFAGHCFGSLEGPILRIHSDASGSSEVQWENLGDGYYAVEESEDLITWTRLRQVSEEEDKQLGSIPLEVGESSKFARVRKMLIGELLAGTWSGSKVTRQAGSCLISGSQIKTEQVEFRATDQFNGSHSLRQILFGRIFFGAPLLGSIDEEGNLSFSRTSNVNCNGVQNSNTYEYEGRLEIVEGRLLLTLNAREVWCPEMNCVFDVSIELRKGPLFTLDPPPFDFPIPGLRLSPVPSSPIPEEILRLADRWSLLRPNPLPGLREDPRIVLPLLPEDEDSNEPPDP